MKITVIICSYNRAEILRDSLASFLEMARPTDATTELLVVDNNSNDSTPAVIESFVRRDPQLIRALREPAPGLSRARNTGIRSCDADVIAFADDDVYFDSQWLVELLQAFRDHPEVMCVGGRSVPLFEAGTPDWLSPRVVSVYGATNSGDTVRRMIFPEHPFGLNMAFRREVFERVGLFDVRLGRKKGSLLSNEETEIFYRIHNAQLPVLYTPTAWLHHRIPAERTRKQWVLDRYYWQGISDVALEKMTEKTSRLYTLRQVKWKVSQLLPMAVRTLWPGAGANQSTKFARQVDLWYQAGTLRQLIRETLGS